MHKDFMEGSPSHEDTLLEYIKGPVKPNVETEQKFMFNCRSGGLERA